MIDDTSRPGSSSDETEDNFSSTPGGSASSSSSAGDGGPRFTHKAHGFIDRASEMLGTGSDRVRELHQQYGDKAREQVRAKPLAAIGAAVAVGVVLSKLLRR